MRKIKVRCFGAFRKYVPSGSLEIEVTEQDLVSDFKVKLSKAIESINQNFSDSQLIHESVVANQNEVLPLNYLLEKETEVAILPPVCGG